MVETEVSYVCNHVSQLVSFDSILSTTSQASVLGSNLEHLFFLHFTDVLGALKERSSSGHLVFFEAQHLEDIKVFDLVENSL